MGAWPAGFLEPAADLALRSAPRFVTDELVSMRDVTGTLAALRSSPQVGPNLRVAVDGGYRQDVRQHVIDSDPAHDGQSLESWADRLFGERPFYVVINELEVFNPALARRTARLLWPLVESQTHWFGGLSLALLIGREGYTSFGIHRDGDCRWNLQFHLGPAPKSMIVWEDAALAQASNAELLAVEALLPNGTRFEVAGGDLFVLPCRRLHAAHYTELAVTLVASMRVTTGRSLAEAAFGRLIEERTRQQPRQELALGSPTSTSKHPGALAFDEPTVEIAIEGERLRRWSNLGMTVRNAERLPTPAEVLGKTLSIADPFPICPQALPDGRLRVAARGHTLTVTGGERIGALLEQLNRGDCIEVSREMLPQALMLCAFLIGHGAVVDGAAPTTAGGAAP
jgi:hypothetical protein